MTTHSRPRVFFRDQPVKCLVCGRSAKRNSMRQFYCSSRCRKKAENDRAAQRRLERLAGRKLPEPISRTGDREVAPEYLNNSAGYKGPKTGSSVVTAPIDLVGGSGRCWPNAPHIDRDLWEAIIDAEIGRHMRRRHRTADENTGSAKAPADAKTPDAVFETAPGEKTNSPTVKQETGWYEGTA